MKRTSTPTRLRTRLATAAVLAPLALGLAACGDDDDTDGATTPTATVTESGDTGTEDTASTAAGALETAAETALGAVEGSILFSVDLDAGGWDATVVTPDSTESDLGLGADGTTITRGPTVEPDDADDADDLAERERLLGVQVDYLAAVEAAQGSAQGPLTGVDLSEDNGVAVWEVQFGEDTLEETTVDVDAESGEVLRTEQGD